MNSNDPYVLSFEVSQKGDSDMIFDADTHMSPYRNFDKSIDAAQWSAILDKAGIDKALAWLLPQGVDNVSESNRYLYDCAKEYQKLLPFGWVNIREGLGKAISDVEQCIGEFGFSGVKLNGAQGKYNIDCADAMKVCERIAKLGGMIAFHIGMDAPDFTDPKRAANVAKEFPETKVLMVHMGGAWEIDCGDKVIEIAKENPNMVLIGSHIAIDKVASAIRALGAERVLYGSDIPFADPQMCLSEYRQMLASFTEEEKNAVLGDNAKRLFKLG